MNRNYTYMIIASLLASAGMSASAQTQTESPRQSLHVADLLTQERSGLYSAIAIAETHTNGVAIGVHLSSDHARYAGHNRVGLQSKTSQRNSNLNNNRQETDRARQSDQNQNRSTGWGNETPQSQTRSADQRNALSQPLFAIVTCVVDDSKVRDVIVDMESNTVIGVRSAAYRYSEQHDLYQQTTDGRNYSSEYDASAGASSNYALASNLMNATVRNTNGEDLGDIEDLAIDPDSNCVVYGVLRRGGFLGMGESSYAIPSSELTNLQNERIVIALNEDRFDSIRGFDDDNWPMKAESKLNLGKTAQNADAPTAKRIMKASNIIGNDLQCRDGHDFGEITDLVVEPRTGRVIYAIVDTDRGHMPVPMSSLKKSGSNYSLPMAQDQLRTMPVLDIDIDDQNWGDENWNQLIHKSYGANYETASARSAR